MRRWLDWQFAVPRLLAIVVALLAAQYVLGIVARQAAIQYGRTAGVPVEIGHTRVSLWERQVVFDNVHIGGLDADRCELKFEAGPAFHKQAVVESGRISGLRFGNATNSGRQSKSVATATGSRQWFPPDVDVAAQKWLERLNGQFSLDAVKDFDSVTRTDTFCTNWSKCSAGLESRLQEMDGRSADLQQAVAAAEANPLRNDKLLVDLRKKVAGLQKEFGDFSADVDQLPEVVEKERRAIVAARSRDDVAAGKWLQPDSIEASSLSTYLLRDEAARQLDQLVELLRWMREAAPANAKLPVGGARGESIQFAGCQQIPGLVIRSLQLDGTARMAGQPVELRGMLLGASSAPRLHNEPIRLHLVGSGPMPLELQATIDRISGVVRDELLLECQGVLMREMVLGKADQLGLSLAPSIGSLIVRATSDGDRLSGDIQLVQQRVQITPVVNVSGGTTLSAAMNDTLGRVNSIETRITLGGTLKQPRCALSSNLGTAVADAMQRAVRRTGDQQAKALLVEAGRRVDERLAEVDRQMAERQAQFASKSNGITARLEKMSKGDEPSFRISEKGGRRLPANSLFR